MSSAPCSRALASGGIWGQTSGFWHRQIKPCLCLVHAQAWQWPPSDFGIPQGCLHPWRVPGQPLLLSRAQEQAGALRGGSPVQDLKVSTGRKKSTLFINKGIFSTQLARHPNILVHEGKKEQAWRERSESWEATCSPGREWGRQSEVPQGCSLLSGTLGGLIPGVAGPLHGPCCPSCPPTPPAPQRLLPPCCGVPRAMRPDPVAQGKPRAPRWGLRPPRRTGRTDRQPEQSQEVKRALVKLLSSLLTRQQHHCHAQAPSHPAPLGKQPAGHGRTAPRETRGTAAPLSSSSSSGTGCKHPGQNQAAPRPPGGHPGVLTLGPLPSQPKQPRALPCASTAERPPVPRRSGSRVVGRGLTSTRGSCTKRTVLAGQQQQQQRGRAASGAHGASRPEQPPAAPASSRGLPLLLYLIKCSEGGTCGFSRLSERRNSLGLQIFLLKG